MNAKSKRRRQAIDKLICRLQQRLIYLYGPEVALRIFPHLDKALAEIAYASIEILKAGKDERDLLIAFTEILSDANNMMVINE